MDWKIVFFYARRALFSAIFPGVLAFFSMYNDQPESSGNVYKKVYLYSAIALFIYQQLEVLINFTNDVLSDTVILGLDSNKSNQVIYTQKIVKFKHSKKRIVRIICLICWFFGMECPTVVPESIINQVAMFEEDDRDHLIRTVNIMMSSHHPSTKLTDTFHSTIRKLNNVNTNNQIFGNINV